MLHGLYDTNRSPIRPRTSAIFTRPIAITQISNWDRTWCFWIHETSKAAAIGLEILLALPGFFLTPRISARSKAIPDFSSMTAKPHKHTAPEPRNGVAAEI